MTIINHCEVLSTSFVSTRVIKYTFIFFIDDCFCYLLLLLFLFRRNSPVLSGKASTTSISSSNSFMISPQSRSQHSCVTRSASAASASPNSKVYSRLASKSPRGSAAVMTTTGGNTGDREASQSPRSSKSSKSERNSQVIELSEEVRDEFVHPTSSPLYQVKLKGKDAGF